MFKMHLKSTEYSVNGGKFPIRYFDAYGFVSGTIDGILPIR